MAGIDIRSRTDYGGRLVFYENVTPFPTVHAFGGLEVYEDFTGLAIDVTNDWNHVAENGSTLAYNAQTGGACRITTGNADNNSDELSTGLVFLASKGPCIEARVAVDAVTHTAVFVGFSDAVDFIASVPLSYNANAFTHSGTNAIGFVWDADSTAGFVRMMAINAAAHTYDVATTTALTNSVYHVFRVETDQRGNARFFIDGVYTGACALAIATTSILCADVGVSNRHASVHNLDIDYIRAWQDR